MFEAALTLCLTLSAEVCRPTLLPGYEAETRAACAEALAARPPDPGLFDPLVARGAPSCAPAGPALDVTQVAPGLFVHRGTVAEPDAANLGDVSNIAFVIGEDSVAVIDSGGSRAVGEATWRAIRARTDKPLSHAILTHMHPDHVFGASVFAEAGAEIVGHAKLPRALSDRAANYGESFAELIGPGAFIGSRIVEVDRTIAEGGEIDLGGRALALKAWPLAHTETDLSVFDPMTRTLIAGDLVFDDHVPALDGSLRGWQEVLAELSRQDAVRVVPGHGGPVLDWPDGAAPLGRYLDTLAADTRAAIDAGERLGEAVTHIAQEEAGSWALFDAYNPRNATVAFTELEWE
ncbi:quinoprotein relay system zinc metallohydrolase 2 [Roseivivax sediminis]|uniref:Quinoprotein relay system zinc metallohydrolase 2 n=1 Tax=Roseivivax sediminis TaxID=936889 RepID=A0A1I1TWR8_9RHOB|nr:quinoprotein relay system zinc metallohydrolase 2 [Roseivivax sediminis]SFD62969.1 quinoprotein relay system zinc metallohydrolase 2 [Roseivivax sediminis]